MERFINAVLDLLFLVLIVCVFLIAVNIPSCLDDFSKTKIGREFNEYIEENFTPIEDEEWENRGR